ncbi:hypothetical protein BGZ58_002299 [Dissophora ornata]|nr:hypothetical protein BGZ58_002299 [Dissophora ornata]
MPGQGPAATFGSGGGFGGRFGAIPATSGLTRIPPPTPCPTLVKDVPLEQYLISIFEHSHNLETLQLKDFMLSKELLVRTLVRCLKNLKVLDLKAEQSVRAPVRCLKILLENLPPTVETLSLEYALLPQEEDVDKVEKEDKNGGEAEPLLAVKTLVLNGDMAGHASALWIPFLRRCRHLESLSLQSLDSSLSNKSECLGSTLTEHCPSLQELILNRPSDSFRDADLARLILAPAEGWRRLHITYSLNFGLLSSEAVVEKCGRLEYLAIEGSGGFESRFLQRLLSKCKSLKYLEAITESEIPFLNNVYLDARDIITSSWVCQDTLQSLKVIIPNIPRPDVKEGPGRWPLTGPLHDGTIQDGAELQRRVLAQIGRMTRLECLWLGHDDQDPEREGQDNYGPSLSGMIVYLDRGFQYSCLELSLSSQSDGINGDDSSGSVGGGLELLEGLKELKGLDVRRMSHRIGQAEVEWMVKKWPKMKSMVGLGYGQGKWLKKHCPQIKVHYDRDYSRSTNSHQFTIWALRRPV